MKSIVDQQMEKNVPEISHTGYQKTQNKQEKRKYLKNEIKLRDLLDHMKQTHICIIEVPEEEERERGRKLV